MNQSEKQHNKKLSRGELENRFKWRLEDLFESDELWEEEFGRVDGLVEQLSAFRGRVVESDESLLSVLKLSDELGLVFERLYVYAHMRMHEDTRVAKYQELSGRIEQLGSTVSAANSFVVPEIVAASSEIVWGFVKKNSSLALYSHLLDDVLRLKKHVLSEPEERLLALFGDVARAPRVVFGMFNDADTSFPKIIGEDGKSVEVTHGNFGRLMKSKSRRVRRETYEALYGTYLKHKNTLAALLNASVRKEIVYSSVRGYESPLHAALMGDNIDVGVYTGLLDAVSSKSTILSRYVSLRGEVLGLEDGVHKYDLSVPFVENVDRSFSFDEAVSLVRSALKPLGKQYAGIVDKGFSSGWVDVFETEGKRSGGYSWGAFGSHPYILLNFEGTLNDVFTVAHEMGHAVHSFLSMQSQPFVYAEYKIFLAEIASTVNEVLLMRHLLSEADDSSLKVFLLDHFMQQFRGTVFAQSMFAEFEKNIHELGKRNVTLTSDVLAEQYAGLVEKYYGKNLVLDEGVSVEWGIVPHFYSPFYVYQYATGFSAALAFSEKILSGDTDALERYLGFLSAGNSKYPLEVLRDAGLEMVGGGPVKDGLVVCEKIVDELRGELDGL